MYTHGTKNENVTNRPQYRAVAYKSLYLLYIRYVLYTVGYRVVYVGVVTSDTGAVAPCKFTPSSLCESYVVDKHINCIAIHVWLDKS